MPFRVGIDGAKSKVTLFQKSNLKNKAEKLCKFCWHQKFPWGKFFFSIDRTFRGFLARIGVKKFLSRNSNQNYAYLDLEKYRDNLR